MDQTTLLESIITNTPEPFRQQARNLITLTLAEGLDRRTLEKTLSVATTSDEQKYDATNFNNLTYAGEFIGQGTSDPTGQTIYSGIILKNKKNEEQITLGPDTALKLHYVGKKSGVLRLPELDTLLNQKDEDFEPSQSEERLYVDTLQEVLADHKKIKDIQSSEEKRAVKGLIGLQEEKERVGGTIKELFKEYLFSDDLNAEKINEYTAQLLMSSGTHIKRLKERYDTLPNNIKGKFDFVTKGRKFLTPETYFSYQRDLRIFDNLTSPVHNTGKAKEYIEDLKIIVEEGSDLPNEKKLLQDIKAFQSGIGFTSATSLAATFDGYNLGGERLKRVRAREQRSDEYKADLETGKSIAQQLFIKEATYIGNMNNSVPETITKEQKHVTKRGDKMMQAVQAWTRANYFSKEEDDVYEATSISDNSDRLDALVQLARRSNTEERMVDDKQQVAEAFEDQYDITLQEFTNRANDVGRYSHVGKENWRKEKTTVNKEAATGLYTPERFDKLEGLITTMRDDYTPMTKEHQDMIAKHRELRMLANNTPGQYLDSITILPGQSYINKEKIEKMKSGLAQATNIQLAHKKHQRSMNEPQKTHPATITSISDEYKTARPEERVSIKYSGTTFEDRKDFDNAFPRTWWNKEERTRNRQYEKRIVPGLLKRIQDYNRNHENKVTIAIL